SDFCNCIINMGLYDVFSVYTKDPLPFLITSIYGVLLGIFMIGNFTNIPVMAGGLFAFFNGVILFVTVKKD
ncbi:unnamed protein product, partial [marine sediment metagenome]